MVFLRLNEVNADLVHIDCDEPKSSPIGCHVVGNIVLTPQGIKRLFDEKINNPEFKRKIQEVVASSVRDMERQIWYTTPSSCKAVSANDFARSFTLREPLPVRGECILAPDLGRDGQLHPDTQVVPIQLATENFDMRADDIEFDIADPICQNGQCSTQIKLRRLSLVSDFTIRKKSGEILSGPSYRINLEPGKSDRGVAASLEAYLVVQSGGKLDYAVDHSGFQSLRMSSEGLSLEPVIRWQGQVYEVEDLTTPQMRGESRERIQRKQILAQAQSQFAKSLQCEAGKDILRSTNPVEEYERQFLEFKRRRERRSVLTAEDQRVLDRGVAAIRRLQREGAKEGGCENISSEIFSSTSSYDQAYDIAEARVMGFQDLQTKWLFEGVVENDINQGPLKDDRFISNVVIPEIQRRALSVAQRELQSSVRDLSQTVQSLLESNMQVPVVDINLQTRKSFVEGQIKKLTEELRTSPRYSSLDPYSQGETRPEAIKRQLSSYQRELANIDAQLQVASAFELNTQYILESIEGLNRVRIVNRMDLCESGVKIPGVTDGLILESDLQGSEFAFELPISAIQKYIDEMYKKSPFICLEGVRPDCSDGRKMEIPGTPQLICAQNSKCKIDFGQLKTSSLGFQ